MYTETTPMPTTPLIQRILRFPLFQLVIAFFFVGIASGIGGVIAALIGIPLGIIDHPAFALVRAAALCSFYVLGYVAYVRWIEKRPAAELGVERLFEELGGGLLLGAILFTVTIGVIWLAGSYSIVEWNGFHVGLFLTLEVALLTGFLEEILFRGIIFRLVEKVFGTWISLVFSAVLFGLAHGGNPGATVVSTLAIALEAGVLLGAAYLLTRRLWLVIGLHIAWNFVQGGIFGVNVSGITLPGLVDSTLTGPVLLSGGAFGAEASLVAVVVCTSVAVYMLMRVYRNGIIIPPFWQKK